MQLNLDPAGLQNNGGPTQTIALEPNSEAVDFIPVGSCAVTTDQRGFPRPDAGEVFCDVGAYEFQDIQIFVGQPGTANCHGKSVAALTAEFGSLDAAASSLGFSSVKEMQKAIRNLCRS